MMHDTSIEGKNGVHSKEHPQLMKKNMKGKSAADMLAEHGKFDWSKTGGDKIIDVNKRKKAQDITDTGKFILEEPEMCD